MLRLFTALEPPKKIKQELLSVQQYMPGARWQTDEQLHITLNFIGEIDGSLLPEIKKALATIKLDPFSCYCDGVDYFGSKQQPRILITKIVPNAALLKLQKQINHALPDNEIKIEKQKFKPHITLARLNQVSYQSIGEFIQYEALFKTGEFVLDEFHLISSRLSPDGAKYLIEESYPLADRMTSAENQ